MKPSGSRAVSKRAILIQLAILAGLVAFYKLYLPHREKAQATIEAQEREQKIVALFQSLVVEDASPATGGLKVPAGSGSNRAHPQRLVSTPSVQEVEQALGLPDQRTTDFRGGLHLDWRGAQHKLDASFDRGRLYCLRLEDRRTGHGALVFESTLAWHPF